MEQKKGIKSFEVVYGISDSDKLTAYVKNGKICEIRETKKSCKDGRIISSIGYYPSKKDDSSSYFSVDVRQFIYHLSHRDQKTYEEFVNSLDAETLEKYFKTPFEVTYGHHGHIKLTAYVYNGKVYEINEYTNHYLHGTHSSESYTPEDDMFEWMLEEFIHEVYKKDRETYENFVNSLDSETLEKYFKSFYVPK